MDCANNAPLHSKSIVLTRVYNSFHMHTALLHTLSKRHHAIHKGAHKRTHHTRLSLSLSISILLEVPFSRPSNFLTVAVTQTWARIDDDRAYLLGYLGTGQSVVLFHHRSIFSQNTKN